jgi:hypothetical protein
MNIQDFQVKYTMRFLNTSCFVLELLPPGSSVQDAGSSNNINPIFENL